jgi:hypothetical protein
MLTGRVDGAGSRRGGIDLEIGVGHGQLRAVEQEDAARAIPPGGLDAQAIRDLRYTPDDEAVEIDLTDLDSVNDAFETLIQVIPERFAIADPTYSGVVFGVEIESKIKLIDLAPELVEFSLSEILSESVYRLMEPFIRPMDADEAPVLITLPALELPDIGPSVPFVEQFVDLLKTMPSQVRLFNPTVSAALLVWMLLMTASGGRRPERPHRLSPRLPEDGCGLRDPPSAPAGVAATHALEAAAWREGGRLQHHLVVGALLVITPRRIPSFSSTPTLRSLLNHSQFISIPFIKSVL